MHATRVKLKDGKVYEGILSPQHPLKETLRRENPFVVLIVGLEFREIPLYDIASAITRGERLGVRKKRKGGPLYFLLKLLDIVFKKSWSEEWCPILKDIDELPIWLALHEEWHDSLSRWEDEGGRSI